MQALPPLGEVLYIQTFLPSEEHIRGTSVLEVKSNADLASDRLGVNELSRSCAACDAFLEECPGHHGHLELTIPTYRVFYVKQLLNVLNCICFYCQRVRVPSSDKYVKVLASIKDPANRLEKILKHSAKYKYCGGAQPPVAQHQFDMSAHVFMDAPPTCGDEAHVAGGCGKRFVQFATEDRDGAFIKATVHLDQSDEDAYRANPSEWKPFTISPGDVYDCLCFIPDQVKRFLGFTAWNEPHALMWKVLPIPSQNTRPCHTYSNLGGVKKKSYNDWTRFLKAIVTAQNEVKQAVQMSSEAVNVCIYTKKHIVSRNAHECFADVADGTAADAAPAQKAERVKPLSVTASANKHGAGAFGAVEGAWRNLTKLITAFHSDRHKKFHKNAYGKPLTNVEERFKYQKSGRFRGYVTARRVNNAMRGVLEGDIHLHPTQVGIPKQEAMNLSVKIYVNAINARVVYQWIVNGPQVYPGANYVQLKSGEEINLTYYANRRDIDVGDVLFVRRHLHNNDMVMVNRQPTLHKPSMMAFRVVVIEGYAIRLHYCVFLPMAADCDGDEVNVHVPQTDMARAELAELSSMEHCIMKDGVVWIKFIQNAVTGAYLMSQNTGTLSACDVYQLVAFLNVFELPPPTRSDPETGKAWWDGKSVISLLFPSDFTLVTPAVHIEQGRFLRGILNAQTLNGSDGVLNHLYRDYADKSVCTNFLHQGYLMFQAYLDLHGLTAGYYDTALDQTLLQQVRTGSCSSNSALGAIVDQLDRCVDNTQTLVAYGDRFPHHTPKAHGDATEINLRMHIDRLNVTYSNVVKAYHQHFNYRQRNGVINSIDSGASKTYSTLNQMCGMVGQVYVMHQRYNSVSSHFRAHGPDKLRSVGFISQSYSGGLNLPAVIQEAHAACESVINKNKGTSKSGYTVRKLTTCVMGVVADHFGRAVDTNGRVVWQNYGNDGYDSTTLTTANLRLALFSTDAPGQAELWDKYGILAALHTDLAAQDCDVAPAAVYDPVFAKCLEPALRDLGCSQEAVDVLAQEFRYVKAWNHQLHTSFVSRTTRFTDLTKVRCPFSFQHLFDRCRARFSRTPQCLVRAAPHAVRQQVVAFWDTLVDEKCVVASNAMLKMLYFDWMATKRLMLEWRFGQPELTWLFVEIHSLLRRAKITPGDSIGVHATQSLGEPFTQMALKTPHLSGKFSTVVEGAVKFGNLVDGTFTNPIMTVVLNASVQQEAQARLFALSLPKTYFRDVCSLYPTHRFEDLKPVGGMCCVIDVCVDKRKAVQRAVSLRSAAIRASKALGLDVECVAASFATDADWVASFTVPLTSKLWTTVQQQSAITVQLGAQARNMVALNVVHNLFFSVIIHGMPDIENFVCERSRLPGGEERWVVTTMGSNLQRILQRSEVDTTRTTSSDCQDVSKVFGIRAGQKALEHEFMEVMSGTVDERHIKLLARVMVSNLNIQGMKIKQSGQSIPPLQRAAYEQMSRQVTEYCSKAEQDHASTICGAALTNRPMNVGTGYNLDLLSSVAPGADSSLSLLRTPKPLPKHMRPFPYVFSPKVDGLRLYLTFFRDNQGKKICNLVTRNFQVFSAPSTSLFPESVFEGTVLDGDMTAVAPATNQHTAEQHCFVVYDCLLSCGNKTATLRYDQRLAIARHLLQCMGTHNFSVNLTQARNFATLDMGANLPYALPCKRTLTSQAMFRMGRLPFSVTVKPVFAMEGLRHFHTHHMAQFPFPTDGYIFTHVVSGATPFRTFDAAVLKWKPNILLDDHTCSGDTIDVVLGPVNAHHPVVLEPEMQDFQPPLSPALSAQRAGGVYQMYARNSSHAMQGVAYAYKPPSFVGEVTEWKTYECAWNLDLKRWVILRWRDKSANTMETVRSGVQVIRDNVDLLDIVRSTKYDHPLPVRNNNNSNNNSAESPVMGLPAETNPISPVYNNPTSPTYNSAGSPVYNPTSPTYNSAGSPPDISLPAHKKIRMF